MKHRFTILALALAGLSVLSACNGWLEATSSSQVSDKKLFSTRQGFHEALSGVYLDMGRTEAYGSYYTWLINDVVACPFSIRSTSFYKTFQQHLFTNATAQPIMEAMWTGGYNIIANVNKTLQELENGRDIITDETEYRLIRGELLAIRAYVHFDLMRMYGVGIWSGENASKHTVPYVREYSSTPTEQRTYSETAELLMADIEEALECLEADPVRGSVSDSFEATINSDGYWTDRRKHLNYYAVEALAARVCMWKADYAQAERYASDVIDGAFASGLVSWIDYETLIQEGNSDKRDWTFSTEQLFSLDVTDLYSSIKPYYFDDGGIRLDDVAVGSLYTVIPELGINDANEDVRGPAVLLRYGTDGYFINKYYGSSDYDQKFRDRIPMLRISEMYLILAEISLRNFNSIGSARYFDVIASHRGITHPVADRLETDILYALQELALWLDEEYLREFVGEGQYLYFVKRFHSTYSYNGASIPSTVSLYPLSSLIYPYPESETTYGRVQDK